MTLATPHLVVIGANHRTADAGQRERLYLDVTARAAFLEALKDLGLGQAVVISTCDRVEVILAVNDAEAACQTVEKLLAKHVGITPAKLSGQLFRYYDDDAIHHVFSVACALDSQMIGEAQVLGQLKEVVGFAQARDMVGAELDDLFQATYTLAKRVRSQTQIGEGAVSVASAAVKIARDMHGDLSDARGLVIGLGDVGAILIEQFNLSHMTEWIMTGTARRTERLARRRGCHFAGIDDLPKLLEGADVVITASGTGRFVLDQINCETALKARKRKPILVLDCGVPADVDPGIDQLDAIYRYTLEEIEGLAERGQTGREVAADQARNMVKEAVGDYRRHLAERDGIPALVALRAHFDVIRQDLLTDHPNLDAQEATRLLVNRLLHQPSEALRNLAADGDMADFKDTITVNRVLEQLFGLSADLALLKPDEDKK